MSLAMSPIRQVQAEPVLWKKSASGECYADLLHRPTRLLRVYRANLECGYSQNHFSVKGRRIFASPESSVPSFSFEDLYPLLGGCPFGNYRDGRRQIWYAEGHAFHGRQVCVDYETEEFWQGPVPGNASGKLSGLRHRLAERLPIRMALLGDSISCGANASGVQGAPPYQESWEALSVGHLQKQSGCEIGWENFSKGGMTARWGMEQVERIVKFAPHLVLIAFGMNDISEQHATAEFLGNIRTIVERIQAGVSGVECLVISGMTPNPDWTLTFAEARTVAHAELRVMIDSWEGVAFCDVRSTWDYVVSRKGFWSLTGNGVNHPNDYGHRLYAECVLATLGCQSAKFPGSLFANSRCVEASRVEDFVGS